MNVFDEPKIDTHCHVLDPARFAYAPDVAYRPAGQEIGPAAQYRQRAPQRLDVGPLLRQVERLLPDAADRRRVFRDTRAAGWASDRMAPHHFPNATHRALIAAALGTPFAAPARRPRPSPTATRC